MPRLAAVRKKAPAARPARKPAAKKAPAASVAYVRPARSTVAAVKAPPRKADSMAGALGSAIGMALGSALGGPAGGAAGGMIGQAGGRFLSSILGHGDYQVTNLPAIKENSLAVSNAANIPQFGTGKVAVKFKHREYLGDIISSSTVGAFQIQSYPINPGLSTTFPWLSGVVGANFQQYRVNGMTFEFRSMSADALNSTNTALGSVVMSSDYDSADTPFSTKQQMENTEYGVSCKPSANMLHAIECARSQTSVSELYIRAYDNPSGTDVRLYDLARFYIASVGMQAASVNLGELWVTYDIDCFKAIEQPPLYIAPMAGYTLVEVTSANPAGTSVTSNYNPSTPSDGQFPDQIGLTFTVSSVQLPASISVGAVYQLFYWVSGTSTASVAPPVITYTHGLAAAGNKVVLPGTSTTSTFQTYSELFIYNGGASSGAPPTIDFMTGLTVPGSATGGINIYQVSHTMLGNNLY